MNWNWRLVIIVSAEAKPSAEQAARAINSTGPDYSGDAFNMPLSAGGSEPVTHWGLYTSATDEMVSAMATALPQIGGAMYWRHGVDGSLMASNVTQAYGQPWGLDESLAAAGLKAVETPFPA
jgi:hypothetical protein